MSQNIILKMYNLYSIFEKCIQQLIFEKQTQCFIFSLYVNCYSSLEGRENTLIPSVQRDVWPRTSKGHHRPVIAQSRAALQKQPVPLERIWIARRTIQLFSRTESRSLSELTRQITPPTKNGHAPPPTESRKSSQSVNPSSVRAW